MASTHDYDNDSRNNDIQIFINGEFYLRSEAKISVMDSGYLLGDGVWEGIRFHKGHLVHLERHLDRLYEGAKAIEMTVGVSKDEMIDALKKTLEKNKMTSDVHIRLIVSRGIKSTPYQHPKVTIGPPTIVIIPEYKKASPKLKVEGITLGTVKTIRDNRTQDPRINSLSKHNCIAACIEAEKMGVDEGLMLDPNGNVSTCNSTNFFMISNKEVWTSNGEYCLNGVTRSTVINICKQNQIPIKEREFSVQDVHNADEVFVTGTFAGIIPVVSVDGVVISSGTRGALTNQLQTWYELSLENMSNNQ
ncbi:MAG: aminotransferase class IV [Candidatus Neomarinimicrobiota bacterium]|nr:aminotransferase class IV [Candidatus Neomarinimicrobiota bacterium]|tara:strand:+ start:2618 stop:3529 length:912 start_codon:yes stop_codon:yes gene_type:complete